MRIKGKFVGTITIDFDFEKTSNMNEFNIMHEAITKQLSECIKVIISNEIPGKLGSVNVTQQYADLYEVED